MTHHVQDWTKAWPDWVPEPVRHYICHTKRGETIRALAREDGCHPSTVLRQIRQVENARDDLLVDEALDWLASSPSSIVSEMETIPQPCPGFTEEDAKLASRNMQRDVIPVLRKLAQPGAVLAVSAEMDKAVIVRSTDSETTQRMGVVERRVAQALALNRWITCATGARLCQYRISNLGRTMLKTLMAQAENRAGGFREAPGGFSAAPPSRDAPRHRMGMFDTPVLALARRRDRDGDPFLPPRLVRAAERIQDDFELAQMMPRTTSNWDDYLTAGTSGPGHVPDGRDGGASAARARVSNALRVLGPGLGDVVMECCCRLQGLEVAEKKLGWSARSGKIVLRIALQRLCQHYEDMRDGGGLIG